MKTILVAAWVVLTTSFVIPQTAPFTSDVQGTVRRANSSEAVAGAQVTLNGRAGQPPAPVSLTAITDNGGRFTFRGLPAGTFNINVTAEGYVPPAAAMQDPITVTIAPNQQSREITVTLVPFSTISGQVRDSNGQPLNSAKVTALRLAHTAGRRFLISAKSVQTDDRGNYRLFGLAPGEYYVRAEIPARATPQQPTASDIPIRTYFPGAMNATDAIPIGIGAGDDLTGRDFGIQPTAVFKISGKVITQFPTPQTLPSGQPYPGVNFFALVQRGAAVEEDIPIITNVKLGTDGEFEIPGVRPGRYDLYPVVQDGPAGQTLRNYYSSRTPVDVVDKDIEGLRPVVRPGAELKVQVTGVAPAAVAPLPLAPLANVVAAAPPILVRIAPRETIPILVLAAAGLSARVAETTGTATFLNIPPSTYDVSVSPPANHHVADIRQNGQSVMDSGVTITGDTADPIEVILKSGGGTVTGSVQNKERQPVANAPVVLIPQQPHRSATVLYRTITTSATGTFTLRDVAPGEYKLFAWEKANPALGTGDYLDPEFLARYEFEGKSVSVSELSASNVSLDQITRTGSGSLRGLGVTAVAAPLAPQPAANPAGDRGSASIAGIVRQAGATRPIPNVQITLAELQGVGSGASPSKVLLTDAGGQFEFNNLVPGRYVVSAQQEGYFGPTSPVNTPTMIYSEEITVAAQQRVQVAAIELIPGGVIAGRILDPNGRPLSGVTVTPMRVAYSGGQRKLAAASTYPSRTFKTDDRGGYRLTWLAPGEYYLSATPPLTAPARALSAPGAQATSYARTYFPGVTDARSAALVVVAPGSEQNADMSLQSTSLFKISGRVIGLDGAPATVSSFYLHPRSTELVDNTVALRWPNLNPRGNSTGPSFELQGVEPGDYDLYPLIRDTTTGASLLGRTPVTVRNQDLQGVTAVLQPNVDIRARIIVIDGEGAGPQIWPQPIKLQARDALPTFVTGNASRSASDTVDADGAFTYKNVPEGKYDIEANVPGPTTYVADVREGGVSVFDQGLTVGSSPLGLVDVITRTDGGTIDGVVTDADGKPVEGVAVALIPAAAERRGNPRLTMSTNTDAQGRFRLRPIAPGDYKIFAWTVVEPGAWENSEFLSKYENLGLAITVAPKAMLDLPPLKLIPVR